MINLAIFILINLSLICAWGSFSRIFRNSLCQRLGMVVMLFGCLSMVGYVWRLEYIHHAALTFLLGVYLFAVGTALKAYLKHRKKFYYGNLRY